MVISVHKKAIFIFKSKILAILNLFIIFICYSNDVLATTGQNTGIFTTDTEFCLVNSTALPIFINNVWDITDSDWKDKSPTLLLNQKIMPLSSSCWPLILARSLSSYYSFKIAIQTDSGSIAWIVNQYDAVGEIYKKYDTLLNGTPYYLIQKSGDNNGFATNVFIIEDSIKIQNNLLSNWMKAIPNHYTLKNIQIIGTHDAGVNAEDGVNCNIPSDLAIAQSGNLVTQLTHGVRYFDIRLEKNDNALYPYHKSWSMGCSSKKTFEKSLNEIIDFIVIHKSETVFLKLSHTTAPSDSVIKMLDAYTTNADTGKYFYRSPIDTHNWGNKTIGELRGKIIILLDCEYTGFLNPEKGYFSFSMVENSNCNPDDDHKIIYDKYSNTLNFNDMYQDQLNKLTLYGKNPNQLFLLSWTLTGGDIIAHTPRPAANLARLSKEKFGKFLPIPNIVYYDFEDPGINTILIENYKQLLG